MEIHLIIQQLLKDSQPDDILDELVGKIESLIPIIEVSEGASVPLEPENSFYVGTAAGVMPTLIVSEELYPFYLDLDPDEFIARLNKTIFEYIRVKVIEAKQYDSWNDECVWYKPNQAFFNWFHENTGKFAKLYYFTKSFANPYNFREKFRQMCICFGKFH